MSYTRSLLVAVAVISLMDAAAAEIDANAAEELAMRFIQSRSAGKLMTPGSTTLSLAHAEPSVARSGAMDYYIFNASDNCGFVIIAGADDAESVLGYGDGSVDMSNLPDGLQWLLEQYKAQMEVLYANGAVSEGPGPQRDPADGPVVEPLLTSQWSQEEPYYDQCPEYQGVHGVTGCTATAMAQVVNFWKYPDVLPALQSYSTYSLGLEVPALPEAPVDWENMLDTYIAGQYTEAEGAAVAMLMRYCGQSCYMDYTPSASGASQDDQLVGFWNFGYSTNATYLKRDDYPSEEWNALLLEDLCAGRPVSYVGYTDEAGHSFVLDGFLDGKYHVNWGWGGASDGYFTLDILGSGKYVFNYYQSMIHGLYPDPESSTAVCYDFEQDGIYYKQDAQEAIVVNRDNHFDSYSGVVSIPQTVNCDGQTLTVTAIGDRAFMNCGSLTRVEIPLTVRTVGDYAFNHCENLVAILIGKNITSIGRGAFDNCWRIQRAEVEDVAAYCAIEFGDYYAVPFYNGARLYCDGQEVKDLVIPGRARRVSDYAFLFCDGLNSVTIDEGVESIGTYSFFECLGLTSITFPTSLTDIGYGAFIDCYELRNVDFGQGLRNVDDFAFNGCASLESVTLPASMQTIGFAAFAYCDALQRLVFEGGDVNIGNGAFSSCPSLDSLKLSDQQTAIGATAFAHCKALKNLDLGKSLKTIGEEAFLDCSHLERVSLPASVTVAESGAFSQCSSLTRVDAESLMSWCAIDFQSEFANPLASAHHLYIDDELLTHLDVPEGISAVNDNAFRGCEDLLSINIGDGVTSIGSGAFSGCSNMTQAIIGNDVCTIGDRAFSLCPLLSTLTLGQSLQTVGTKAFSSCVGIRDITIRALTPPAIDDKSCFSTTVYKKAVLTVPAAALDAYSNANVWNQFKTIVSHTNSVLGDVNGDGELTIADANALLAMILADEDVSLGDLNGDGDVNIADVNALVDMILKTK